MHDKMSRRMAVTELVNLGSSVSLGIQVLFLIPLCPSLEHGLYGQYIQAKQEPREKEAASFSASLLRVKKSFPKDPQQISS